MTRRPFRHLESVMGTIVGITSPAVIPAAAVDAAVAALRDADRIFSTWDSTSPMARLRAGEAQLEELDPSDAAQIGVVLDRCRVAREITGGAFDPWAIEGGVDPTGLVKGWAVGNALAALVERGVENAMVNGGGDIAVVGTFEGGRWRVGIRHPDQPTQLAAVVEVSGAVATSGNYERPGELIDPTTGRTARVASSATVTGPDLDLADALATGLAVGGASVLRAIDSLTGYEAYLIADDGRQYATPGMAFVDAT